MFARPTKMVPRISRQLKKRRSKQKESEFNFEKLEDRKVLNATPFINHDLEFVTATNTTLTILNTADGVLANDFDGEGSSLSATKIADPANGSVTLSSDGTFTYIPNTGFVGVDTFTYTTSDGTNSSAVGTVQVTVGDGLTGALNGETRNTSLLADGIVKVSQPIGGGLELAYSSDTIPVVLVPIETLLAAGTSIPNSITANLTIDGVSSGNVTFNNTGLSTGQPLRFSLRSLTTTSATGMHDWTVDVDLEYSGSTLSRTFSGSQAIVNRANSEFGTGWWLDGLDQIHDQSNGALLVKGDGSTLWFEKDGASYHGAEGDLSYSILTKNGAGEFTLTDKWGDYQEFNSNGLLTSVLSLNNSNASFTFTYNGSGRVSKITDEFNREFSFSYDSNGKLSSTNDFYNRDSSFTINGGKLTDVTLTDETAPGYVAPEWSYGYKSIGGKNYLDEVIDPADNATEFVYRSSTRRLWKIINSDHTANDPSVWKLYPTIAEGYSAGSGNTLVKVSDMNPRFVNEEGHTFKFETDRFGNTTKFINATNDVTTYEYDDQSLLYRLTEADPDGGGALASPITIFGYSALGNLVFTQNPDATTTTATYHSTLNQITQFVNELGNSVNYSYQADGDLASFTDEDGNAWTYTYDIHGNMLSETSPDPDGSGSQYTSITTIYQYHQTFYNRLKKVIWDNGDFQKFTYNSKDQVATFTDELGNVTSYEYDPLDRLTKETLPDPDGGGSQTSPIYSYEYGSNLLLSKEVDPLNNATEYEYNSRGWLTKMKLADPDGAGTLTRPEFTYAYDKLGNVITETRPEFSGVSIEHTYDSNGQVIETSGPLANQDTTYSYDGLGRVTSVTDPSGRVVNYEYDSRSRQTKFIDHDPDGNGSQVGPTTEYEYDDLGQLVKVIDPLGRETTYAYYVTGLLKTSTRPDPDGSGPESAPATTYDYDSVGRHIKTTDAADRVYQYEYNIFGQRTKFIDVDPDDTGPAASPETDYVFDKAGRLTSKTDPMGFVIAYSYDDLGRNTSITLPDPDGSGSQVSPVFSFEYDAAGNLLSETNPLSWVTSYTYDDLHRVKTVTEPDPDGAGSLTSPIWTYTYGDNFQLASTKDPLNHTTTYGYDATGRMTSVEDALGNTTNYTYDLLNRITEVELPDPDGSGPLSASKTIDTYDVYSRIVETEDANGDSTLQAFDIAGQLLSVTDASGNVTQWAYDDLGRVSMETDELGYTESYYYNILDRLIGEVDRESKTILYGFDGHKEDEYWYQHPTGTTPLATIETSTQGAAGTNEVQTITLTDSDSGHFRIGFNGQTTDPIEFDATASAVANALEGLEAINDVSVTKSGNVFTVTFQGNLAGTNVPNMQGDVRLDSDGTEIEKITRVFDDNFRLIEINDSWADYEFTLDDLGRVTSTSETIAGFTSPINLDYTYDRNGNRTSTTVNIGAGWFAAKEYVNNYTFDRLDRLIRVEQTGQSGGNAVADKRIHNTYNKLGQVKYTERFENLTGTYEALRTKYTYDGANRLTDLQHRHVENITTSHALAEYSYTYDQMNRITEVDSTQDGISVYSYDSVGQLTNVDHAAGRADETYTFDATGNRSGGDYVVSAKNHTDESTGFEYEYDRNGNRIKRLKTLDNSYELYEFDHRNRMTGVEFFNASDVLQKTITYAYDVFNRMVRRTLDSDGPGGSPATDQFFAGFDGIHATLEFDGDNKDDLSHRYLWGLGHDELLADEQLTSTSSTGEIFWTLGDQVGTIRDVGEWNSTTTEFEIANHLEYDSFGNLVSETNSSIDVEFGFNGKWVEGETGYTHHLNRWFDSEIGKWISEDPIGFAAGDANITRFVGNKAVTHIDPDGLDEVGGMAIVTTGGQGYAGQVEDSLYKIAAPWTPNTYDPQSGGYVFSSGPSKLVSLFDNPPFDKKFPGLNKGIRNYRVGTLLTFLPPGDGGTYGDAVRHLLKNQGHSNDIFNDVAADFAIDFLIGKGMGKVWSGGKKVIGKFRKPKPFEASIVPKRPQWKGPADYSGIPDHSSVGPGKKFTPSQKKKFREHNAKHNDGVLRSDLDGRPLDPPVQSKKGVKANMNQAEVDHVHPKSKGGSNSSSNAQILSKKQNLDKLDR
jgi:RHS repeat-associated protein